MTDKKDKLIPKLRFPEFKNDGEWESYAIEDLFEVRNGYTPSKSNPEFWEGGTIPWFRMEDIRQNGHILSDSIQHITPQAVKGTGLFPAYSIIVATTATIGEHALLIADSLANQQFTFLTKRKSLDDKLDMMFFHQYMFIVDEWCKRNTNFGGLLSVNMSAFKKLRVPVPSIQEQKRIADFLTSLDNLLAGTKAKLEQLIDHKKGLMQKLFPALGKALPEYRFPEFNNGGIWNESTLGELGEAYSGLSGKNKEDFGHGDAEYITYMNVFSNPIVKSGLNQPIEIDRAQHQVQYGDVFFTISSETPEEVGMSSVWLDNKANVYLNSFCFGFRLKKPFNYIYLSYYFRSPSFRKRITLLAQGISRYNISKNKVLELVLQYPSLDEQERIASCLYSLDESINACSQQGSTLVEQKKGLIQRLFPTID